MTDHQTITSKITVAYPQVFSVLKQSLDDWQLAEDCLQDAIEKALTHWQEFLPDNPNAWLIQVARNKAIDHYRKHNRLQSEEQFEFLTDQNDISEQALKLRYKDDVLRLIFCVCHPAINSDNQIILTLKQVMGFTNEEIARALLLKIKTVEQRITRAKKKIEVTGIPFEVPSQENIHLRLKSVMTAVYLIFNEGYSATSGQQLVRHDLCNESIRLTRILVSLIPEEPELLGLLALMLNIDARKDARADKLGELVLLEDQNRKLWNSQFIQEAEALLQKAMLHKQSGPYQIQAAIASLHNQANTPEQTDWKQIFLLYQKLITFSPTAIVQLNACVAEAKAINLHQGYEKLILLETELASYVPYHAAKAALSMELGDEKIATKSFQQAIQLSQSEPEISFFQSRLKLLSSDH